MIETIFFDLGGVLINFSHEKMCHNLARFCHLDLDLVQRALYEQKLGQLYERGAIDSQELHRHFSSLAKHPLEFEGLMHAAAEIFSPKEEMLAVVEELKNQGIRLLLLSNTCEAHFLYIKKNFEFLRFFDQAVLSYEVKACKPEKEIYQTALSLTESPIEKCFYVDDVPEYVNAAIKFGLDSHYFQDRSKLIEALADRGLCLFSK